jgi:hypothetical protein
MIKNTLEFLYPSYERILLTTFVCVFVISACAQKATQWSFIDHYYPAPPYATFAASNPAFTYFSFMGNK